MGNLRLKKGVETIMDENDKVVKFMHPGGILHPKTVLMSEYKCG